MTGVVLPTWVCSPLLSLAKTTGMSATNAIVLSKCDSEQCHPYAIAHLPGVDVALNRFAVITASTVVRWQNGAV